METPSETPSETPPKEAASVAYGVAFFIVLLPALVLIVRPVPVADDLAGTVEVRYVVDPPERGPEIGAIARTLTRRLDALGVNGTVVPLDARRVVARWSHRGETTEVVCAALERRGALVFKLPVAGSMSPAEIDAEITRLLALKEKGTYDPARDRWDVATRASGGHVLLEEGGIPAEAIEDAYRTIDHLGRPAVGFRMAPAWRKKFHDLTGDNLGRALAIVIDGVAISEPLIRAPISEHGIIEFGSTGYTESEVRALIGALSGGHLPVRPQRESAATVLPPSLDRAALKLAPALAVALALVVLMVVRARGYPGCLAVALKLGAFLLLVLLVARTLAAAALG